MTASQREQVFVAARRRKLLDARASGLSFDQIVEAGLPADGRTVDEHFATYRGSVAAAVQDAKRALAARAGEIKVLADYQIAEELTRLAGLERRAHTILVQATNDRDRANALRAVDQLRKLAQRRHALLALDKVSAQATTGAGGKKAGALDEVAVKRARRRAAVRNVAAG